MLTKQMGPGGEGLGQGRGGMLGPRRAVLATLSPQGCFLEEDSAS